MLFLPSAPPCFRTIIGEVPSLSTKIFVTREPMVAILVHFRCLRQASTTPRSAKADDIASKLSRSS